MNRRSAARRAALLKRYGGMAAYPSSASIPSKALERLLFVVCALIASVTIAGVWMESQMHGGANGAFLASGGFLFALPYGLAGWWLRRRRLRRVRERQALLAEL